MKKLIIAFCGHKTLGNEYPLIKEELKKELLRFIDSAPEKFFSFYFGLYGEFNEVAESVVEEISRMRTFKFERVYITPYMNFDSSLLINRFDEFIYPPLESVPPKFAIARRNFWIVENANALFAYVYFRGGGAGKMLEYAEKRFRLHGSPQIFYLKTQAKH